VAVGQAWLNASLCIPGLVSPPVAFFNTYLGVFLSLVISGFPFSFLLISSYLSGIDPSLEAAATTLGASWFQRFRRILLPLLAPGLATTFILTFVSPFASSPRPRLSVTLWEAPG